MKEWRPQIDLDRLIAALGEDVLALTDEEIRRAHAAAGRSIAHAADSVREQIAAAGDDEDASDPRLMLVSALQWVLARQH
jgi:hypothetical protein